MAITKRMFGKYGPLFTAQHSYDNGYELGLNWTADYRPGGPSYYGYNNWEDSDWKSYCVATIENADEWHRGFKDGLSKRDPVPVAAYVDHIAVLGYN